jgi:hypothetical protein
VSLKSFIAESEQPNPHLKKANRAVNKLKKDYGKNSEVKFEVEVLGPGKISITMYILRFLDSSQEKEFDMFQDDLTHFAEEHSEALKVEIGDSSFMGAAAHSLIKPGKTIDCDALMSQVGVYLTYPATSKKL